VAKVESLIQGSEKLTRIFGYWPSFHDAEVLEVHLLRGDIVPTHGLNEFPILTLKIHLWELTKETDSEGYLVTKHHTQATLRFCDVSDLDLKDFNQQNAILQLLLTVQDRSEPPSPYLAVELVPAFGISASFKCTRVEVVEALLCTNDAMPLN